MLFGYFLHDAKSDNPFPCRELRGSANLDSAHPNYKIAQAKLNPFAAFGGIILVAAATFFRHRRLLWAAMPPFLLPAATIPAASRHFGIAAFGTLRVHITEVLRTSVSLAATATSEIITTG